MVNVFPFRGILYEKKKIKNLAKVMTPPYDVINPEEQAYYYEESPYNIIRLILGQEFNNDTRYNNKYLRAAAFLKGWLHHGILEQDGKPALYLYEQSFSIKGKRHRRLGFIALLRLEDFEKGKVFPHENTLSKPKLDRLELLRACSSNFENIFTIYSDDKLKTMKPFKKYLRRQPVIKVKDKLNTLHSLWRVDDRATILRVMKEMKDKPVFIADGHHRYEASLRYRNEMRERSTRFSEDESYNHIMAFFTPIEGEGLVVLPIHRLVKVQPGFDFRRFQEELAIYFDIKAIPFSKRTEKQARLKALSALESTGKEKNAFLLLIRNSNQYLVLSLRDKSIIQELVPDKPAAYQGLDVTVLQAVVINKILNISPESLTFPKEANEGIEKVLSGEFDLAFILNPTKITDVIEIAKEYEKMPQKSTFFFPKLLSGLVINHIAYNEKVIFEEKPED